MLKRQPWIHFAPDMVTEWQQCMEEGLAVGEYRAACVELAAHPEGRDEEAWALAEKMHKAPAQEGYPFVEPSDLDGIRKARPEKRHTFTTPSKDTLSDKLKGAWTGRIAGCLLGKPVEGMRRPALYKLAADTDNYPLHKYFRVADMSPEIVKELHLNTSYAWADKTGGIEPVDDDTNYTVYGLKLVETHGRNFTPDDAMEGWLSYIPYLNLCTAERVAYRNGALGYLPPETATWRNPFREWIGAQIRADFFGYVHPGDPDAAADMAWNDAAISHVKNGIYGEMFVAGMLAAAAVTDDIMTIIEAGLDTIPSACRLRKYADDVIGWYREGLNREELIEKIHGVYDENTAHGWCHTVANAMIVVMALLIGNGDFGASVCAAVQAAFDTDCNGATVGSIIGMRNGICGIPEEWIAPFGGKLLTTIQDYNVTDVDTLTERTLCQID